MEMDVKQAVEIINSGVQSQRKLAESLGIADGTLRDRIKKAGYVRNEEKKYVQLSPNEQTSETTIKQFSQNEEKNARTEEEKNLRTKERKRDTMKTENKKPTKEPKAQVRKRASFDIDSDLLKELKIYAITEEKNVYEIVENAIRTYLREGK